MKVHGFAAFKAKSDLKEFFYSHPALRADEVAIAITHCGICHSDVHLIDNDWKVSSYPFIPGHEIIGRVTAVGKSVKHLREGDRVGVGWQAGSCHACAWCRRGDENLCPQSAAICVGRHGGYADHVVVDSQFAFVIPPAMDSAYAAPLMCAGITVYAPLKRLGVKAKTKVGIIGMGGLGHLAVQFASAFNAEVTAFSTSSDKKQEVQKLGADHFVLTTEKSQMKAAGSAVDVLLSVVMVDLDWPAWLEVLRPNGKLVILGASPSDMTISPGVLLSSQKSVVGSNTGGIPMMNEMLSFAARHRIRPQIEISPLANVNQALTRVRQNQARYRCVLECGAV